MLAIIIIARYCFRSYAIYNFLWFTFMSRLLFYNYSPWHGFSPQRLWKNFLRTLQYRFCSWFWDVSQSELWPRGSLPALSIPVWTFTEMELSFIMSSLPMTARSCRKGHTTVPCLRTFTLNDMDREKSSVVATSDSASLSCMFNLNK